MEAEELRNILQHLGAATLHNHTIDIVNSFFYGMLVVLFSLSTRILVKKGLDRRATWATFTATLVAFMITTFIWAASISTTMIITRIYSFNNTNTTLQEKIEQSAAAAYAPAVAVNWGQSFLPSISDAVVIWRTWVLFPQQKWVMIAPLILLLGTFATSIASSVVAPIVNFSALANRLSVSGYILSLATNFVSTLLILWRLWTYRKFVRKNLGLLSHRPSVVHNILVVLVESGLAFLTLQIVNIVLLFGHYSGPGSTIDTIEVIFNETYLALSGMFPSIIVILVNYKSSMEEKYGISALMASGEIVVRDVEARPATVGHLSFAVAQSVTGSTGIEDFGLADDVEREKSRIVTGG